MAVGIPLASARAWPFPPTTSTFRRGYPRGGASTHRPKPET